MSDDTHEGGDTMTVRMAVVGAGWVTLNRHLPSLLRHPDVDLVGMVVPESVGRRVRAEGTLEQIGLAQLGSTLDEPWMADVDAVMIGTPPDTHPAVACGALERGKHVLIEKPFALTLHDADRMIEAAEANERVLALVHNLQFSRAATKARRWLDRGRIGRLRAAFGVQSSNHQRRLPVWYKQLPLGLFTDESPHLIYLLQSFLPGSSIESLHVGPAMASDDRTPDLVAAVLRGADGTPGSLQMTFVGAVSEWLLVLMGEQGTILVDFFRDTCVFIPDDRGHLTVDVLRTQGAALAGHVWGTATAAAQRVRGRLDYGNDEVVRRFVSAIRSGVTPTGITAADGRAVVEVLEAAHLAAPHAG